MAVHKHPTLGKISWENENGVHHIKRNGQSVFKGDHAQVAQRWAFIKKKFNECAEPEVDACLQDLCEGGSTQTSELYDGIQFVNEVLDDAAPIEDWIDDFVNSTDPRFDGKTEDKRREMAKAAYYAKHGATESLKESLQHDVQASLNAHITKFKAGHMDADELGDRCVKCGVKLAKKHNIPVGQAHAAVNAHVNSQLGESDLQERSTASLDRAGEIAWASASHHVKSGAKHFLGHATGGIFSADPVKHAAHAGTAVNNVPRTHPAAGPRKSAFAVMHHDGQGWKVSKHERIETAAREFAAHARNPAVKVKLVNHEGAVVHATHESEITPEENVMLVQEFYNML